MRALTARYGQDRVQTDRRDEVGDFAIVLTSVCNENSMNVIWHGQLSLSEFSVCDRANVNVMRTAYNMT